MLRHIRPTSARTSAAPLARHAAKIEFVEGGPWLGPSEREWVDRLTHGMDTPPFGQVVAPIKEAHIQA